ncbi:hypothetical protein FZEAL_2572 [Fusarium zealandicum]|uniref:N-acetyltransferase domain-containing protein n=1 Tax=Fusarium zealandicum TaxID=1053134 RepID=A0A8H4UQI7_9HYPO|nr:hypothetical protein FZEAL_2572 [Fusarium zealandicum]
MHIAFYHPFVSWGLAFETSLAKDFAYLIERLATNPYNQIWAAVQTDDGSSSSTQRIVGTVLVDSESLGMPGTARIRGFIVDERARGLGIGKKLLEGAMDFIQSSGFEKAVLFTTKDQGAAINLYHKVGFATDSVQEKVLWEKSLQVMQLTWQSYNILLEIRYYSIIVFTLLSELGGIQIQELRPILQMCVNGALQVEIYIDIDIDVRPAPCVLHRTLSRLTLIGPDSSLTFNMPNEAQLCIFMVYWPTPKTVDANGAALQRDSWLLASRKLVVRAWPGGTGASYGSALTGRFLAKERGHDQVFWPYGPDRRITEIGSTDVIFMWKTSSWALQLVNSLLHGNNLVFAGNTRCRIIELARSTFSTDISKEFQCQVLEMTISMLEVQDVPRQDSRVGAFMGICVSEALIRSLLSST